MDASRVWEVVPGRGVGLFLLGMPLTDVVRGLRSAKHPEKTEVIFCMMDPLSAGVIVHLPNLRVVLEFHAPTQKLKLITIYQFDRLSLRYVGSTFSEPKSPATFRVISGVFGPTFPGAPSPDGTLHRHNYPGATFVFDMPNSDAQRNGHNVFPTELPDGSSPLCRTLVVYSGESLNTMTIARQPVLHYYEQIVCNYAHGQLYFTGRNKRISIGQSCQDVLTELGAADAQHCPRNDRMLIHYGLASVADASGRTTSSHMPFSRSHDYFLNYFSLGIDIHIDGELHLVKRVMLHTNALAHVDFGLYRKVNMTLVNQVDSSASLMDQDVRTVQGDTKWETIRSIMGVPLGDPVVSGGHTPQNPFGQTLFYGYDGVIFEVMESGYLASVTIYPIIARRK